MHKKRTVVIDREQGVFLGLVNNGQHLLFCKDGKSVIHAYGFDNVLQANKFIDDMLQHRSDHVFCVDVDQQYGIDKYLHVYDIIKSGHGHYAAEMFAAVPTPSETIH